MHKGRLEAFSDGVLAVIITIMVLEMKVPAGSDWDALKTVLPTFLSYLLSFVFVGIYWNNHHHMLQSVRRVNGAALWANLHLLFWLSLLPFVGSWMGNNFGAPLPTVAYGVVLAMAALGYWLLVNALIKAEGEGSLLAKAIGRDLKGKLSLLAYLLALPLAFIATWLAHAIYIAIALVWLVPDRRIERVIND
jgi:uncharacterized membrane protein